VSVVIIFVSSLIFAASSRGALWAPRRGGAAPTQSASPTAARPRTSASSSFSTAPHRRSFGCGCRDTARWHTAGRRGQMCRGQLRHGCVGGLFGTWSASPSAESRPWPSVLVGAHSRVTSAACRRRWRMRSQIHSRVPAWARVNAISFITRSVTRCPAHSARSLRYLVRSGRWGTTQPATGDGGPPNQPIGRFVYLETSREGRPQAQVELAFFSAGKPTQGPRSA